MTSIAEMKTENQEIGDLLLKVQNELKELRKSLSQNESKIDLNILQAALQKTENEIKEKADVYINQMNSQVKTVPSSEQESSKYSFTIQSLIDFSKSERKIQSAKSAQQQNQTEFDPLSEDFVVSTDLALVEEIKELPSIRKSSVNDPSPGQLFKLTRDTKSMLNPYNAKNREVLNENYNIQLPLIEKKRTHKMDTHLINGSTVEQLKTLPNGRRRNPTLVSAELIDKDAKYGLYSLLERGLIPPNAKITFEQFPIVAKQIKQQNENKKVMIKIKDDNSNLVNESIYKLDPNYNIKGEFQSALSSKTPKSDSQLSKNDQRIKSANKIADGFSKPTSRLNNQMVLPPPPVTPATLQLQLYDPTKYAHMFVIQNGKLRTDLSEYSNFKHSFFMRWGSIATIIKYLEELCRKFSIPAGIIDGAKVAELSKCVDMELKPTDDELIETFLNKQEILKLIKEPGRLFKQTDGKNLAAIKIQCAWRRYRDRTAYLQYRKRRWAAGVIALTWLTYVKLSKARESLKITRQKQLENFRLRQKELIKKWPRLKNSKRVIVHIPSLGYSEKIRNNMKNLKILENYHMARISDIIDENVDVIYVTSIPITEETLQYYSKLFGLRTAVQSGNASDQTDFSSRYKIVIPEALNTFQSHNMSLSTLLKYSPKAIRRIKNLIKGRDAYIVPGVMNHDDIHISEVLNIPILAPEPEIANLYSTKSGSKRIFSSAKVDIPFGEFDIYNKEQLYECFAQAITENLLVQRWLFKLDDENDGRGIAFCDVSKHLSCYNWALREMTKFGDKWSKRWAHEPTYVKILEEVPELLEKFATPVNKQAYENWEEFMKAFLSYGGVLEAHPPSDSVTALTVSMIIEPDHTVKILSSGDHVHADSPYSCWGLTFPQTSVDASLLNDACLRIAECCKQRDIIGYIDVDFITFIDLRTGKQLLWATDLNISYSHHVAMNSLLLYLTNGTFNWKEHLFTVNVLKDDDSSKIKKTKKPTSASTEATRYAVFSTKLHHSNLAVIHYSVFFQTCRALGIGYDIKEKQGTVFTLVDSLNHVNMGMITVTDNLSLSMEQFAHNMVSLHHEIGSAQMQGETNFLMAAEDLKNITAKIEDGDENESK